MGGGAGWGGGGGGVGGGCNKLLIRKLSRFHSGSLNTEPKFVTALLVFACRIVRFVIVSLVCKSASSALLCTCLGVRVCECVCVSTRGFFFFFLVRKGV